MAKKKYNLRKVIIQYQVLTYKFNDRKPFHTVVTIEWVDTYLDRLVKKGYSLIKQNAKFAFVIKKNRYEIIAILENANDYIDFKLKNIDDQSKLMTKSFELFTYENGYWEFIRTIPNLVVKRR